ncbi:NAD(P)H:quinone oxidoreductase [Micromonospora sp. DR5-3]|uniref:NAD(P)H:quinone oxidoreductase n=1 Tax=unclassified Micromonospora TaxID=2617518 RepID=UPI0011D51106|nr:MULTISPECIES: NAD(P)H:quinone oxidoreductase [unclassified Micromonospora]MCW3814394.1 NAD(P)H:quinone oxidoreductase [Micromonospora sp. DR5-3]TYC22418.1 NAD(P)H:quinone oxidoreductase [Micromonospora sp. MP36]
MAQVKLSVIYYSATGTIHAMSERVVEAAQKAGAEVRLRQVPELAPPEAIASNAAWSQHFDRTKNEPKATADDIVWADAVIFGSPTRYGNIASQLKQFLDTLGPQWAQGLLADKAYAGFTASQTAHGGQETTLMALYNTIYHFGGIIVPPGYTDPLKFVDGNPYGVSHVTGGNNTDPLTEAQYAALDHLAERVVKFAGKIS